MTISVIIPAWNAQRHIARAIRSVLAQTRPADEIIVVDDGSTDGTADTVRAFGSKVSLITQLNGGVSVARNTGIAAATGEWIAFLDADDEWLPDKLRLQLDCHRCYPDIKWSFTRLQWDRPEWSRPSLAHPDSNSNSCLFEDYLAAYCQGYFVSTITVMVHQSVFDAVGFFDPGMKRAQANDLWFRIAYQFPQVGYVPQPLAVYHLDTPGSSTKINDSVEFMINLIERHRTLSQKFNRADAFHPCIMHMLQVWIRQLEKQNRRADIDSLLGRYHSELSPRFCREMWFRMLFPPMTSHLADIFLTLKKSPSKPKSQCPTT